ncbi:MAG: hypothetical protein BYD32DRAFT_463761 [Podila humilis]|nr:MAG: hypothetical protein BYD32DRAFT_463761 [Podila humilis]
MDERLMEFEPGALLENDHVDAVIKKSFDNRDNDRFRQAAPVPDDMEVELTTMRQSQTLERSPETCTYSHCRDCSMRLKTIVRLQVQLETMHKELEELVQRRRSQEEQINKLQKHLDEIKESIAERTGEIEFLQTKNRDGDQAKQRLLVSLQNIERELVNANIQACEMQNYCSQSCKLEQLIHDSKEQLDKFVAINQALSEQIKLMTGNNKLMADNQLPPSPCHRLMRSQGATPIDTSSHKLPLSCVWLVIYLLFCSWCIMFTPGIMSSWTTSFWPQCSQTTTISPT